jgi:leucyl aminopeptidase
MSSYAAEFLRQFVDGRPWVHIDIAGTAWGTSRNYVGKGATGFGTRLLIELAGRAAA